MRATKALVAGLFLAVLSSVGAQEFSILFKLPDALRFVWSTRVDFAVEGDAGSRLTIERSVRYELARNASGYELRVTPLGFRYLKAGVEQTTAYGLILPSWSLLFSLDGSGTVTGLLNAAEVLGKLSAAYSASQLAQIRQALDLDKQIQADAAEWGAFLAKHASRTYVVGPSDAVKRTVSLLDGTEEDLTWATGARLSGGTANPEAVLSYTYSRAKPSQAPDIAAMSDLARWWWSETYGEGVVEHRFDLTAMLIVAESETLRLGGQVIRNGTIVEWVKTQTSSSTYRYDADQ